MKTENSASEDKRLAFLFKLDHGILWLVTWKIVIGRLGDTARNLHYYMFKLRNDLPNSDEWFAQMVVISHVYKVWVIYRDYDL